MLQSTRQEGKGHVDNGLFPWSFIFLSPACVYKYMFTHACGDVLLKHANILVKDKLLLSSMKRGGARQYHMHPNSTASGGLTLNYLQPSQLKTEVNHARN